MRLIAALLCIVSSSVLASGPYEGFWEECEQWKGERVCSSFTLFQQGQNICGFHSYWASGSQYDGQLYAVDAGKSADILLTCGANGSAGNVPCSVEAKGIDYWESHKGYLLLCGGNLISSYSGGYQGNKKSCKQLSPAQLMDAAYPRKPLKSEDRKLLETEGWLKTCLDRTK